MGSHPRRFLCTLVRQVRHWHTQERICLKEKERKENKEENKRGRYKERGKAPWLRCREYVESESKRSCTGRFEPAMAAPSQNESYRWWHLSKVHRHEMSASWRVLCYFGQTQSKPGGTHCSTFFQKKKLFASHLERPPSSHFPLTKKCTFYNAQL